MAENLPDPATRFGALVRDRLATDIVIWLTTVGADGTPQPNPVWFVVDDDGFLVYNQADAHRLTHIKHRPRVALNLNSPDGSGVVVFAGSAARADDVPPCHEQPAYVEKYLPRMERISGTAEKFAADYPVPMRIKILSTRGF
ncbi:MAG TPA: TIGR03667 family PPOX class F420-dependent oxidoreductase [Pseudonocardiaceae bacterium]|nr:TIGR03667 family PPOX class F420-dependent oxidoreductase [Pseudonocardiaceae bacterium]